MKNQKKFLQIESPYPSHFSTKANLTRCVFVCVSTFFWLKPTGYILTEKPWNLAIRPAVMGSRLISTYRRARRKFGGSKKSLPSIFWSHLEKKKCRLNPLMSNRCKCTYVLFLFLRSNCKKLILTLLTHQSLKLTIVSIDHFLYKLTH